MVKGLIGIIVPVYKVEKYIAECIESILAQTYTNFRLILVDDGSPDNAGKICDEYAKKDTRITVIHQENAGVTRARARGVEEASDCEFITFVDSDDTIVEKALGILFHNKHQDCDIVISPDDEYVPQDKKMISATEYRKILIKDKSLCNGPLGKLFDKKLFNKKTFCIPREIVIGEDLLMNINLAFKNTKNISIIPTKIYNYRMREDSATHTYKRNVEYEELFYRHLRLTIPDNEWDNYAIENIDIRLIRFRNFCGYNYFVKNIFCTQFYADLKKDIELTAYPIKGFNKILFYNKNFFIRFFVINILKLKNIIKKTQKNKYAAL